MEQQGNYQTLRSTRELRGNAEEIYRDLLLGDLDGVPIQGRHRWEKRLSHEEVILSVSGVSNEEKIPFLSSLLTEKTKKEELAEGSSVILKEWRKMKTIPTLSAMCMSSYVLMTRRW